MAKTKPKGLGGDRKHHEEKPHDRRNPQKPVSDRTETMKVNGKRVRIVIKRP